MGGERVLRVRNLETTWPLVENVFENILYFLNIQNQKTCLTLQKKKKKRKKVFILTSRNLENYVLSLITYLKQFLVVIFMIILKINYMKY